MIPPVEARRTQREIVLRALVEAGRNGVSALDFLSAHGVYRAGARVFELRNEGYTIRTVRVIGNVATYVLDRAAA